MKKVVIIDDSSTQLNVIKLVFEKNNWTVCAIQDTRQAMDVIFRFAPDLIITDAIMPNIGGFQLIKIVRSNDYTSKIPIIVYSILSESNAKFYIRKELNEFFLGKNDNLDELLNLAAKVVTAHPLEETYKKTILQAGYMMRSELPKKPEVVVAIQEKIRNEKAQLKPEYHTGDIKKLYEKDYDFSYDDKALMEDIFETTAGILDYDLGVICLDYYNDADKKVYFDIRNIILSPILQSSFLNKYKTKNLQLCKKYMKNSMTMINEREFAKKLEFDFIYNEKNLARAEFFTNHPKNFNNEENLIKTIKDGLLYFFKSRYINKNTFIRKKQESYNQNQIKLDSLKKFVAGSGQGKMYLGILSIKNYRELKTTLARDELDFITTKVSEKIVSFLDETEQVKKEYNDEYNLVFFARDKSKALSRLSCIVNAVNIIDFNGSKVETAAAAIACSLENNNNYETEKKVRELLDRTTQEEKVVVG